METKEVKSGIDEKSLFESMTPEAIVDYILHMGKNITDLERKMNLASEVLESAHGTSVEDILVQRGTMLAHLTGENDET